MKMLKLKISKYLNEEKERYIDVLAYVKLPNKCIILTTYNNYIDYPLLTSYIIWEDIKEFTQDFYICSVLRKCKIEEKNVYKNDDIFNEKSYTVNYRYIGYYISITPKEIVYYQSIIYKPSTLEENFKLLDNI